MSISKTGITPACIFTNCDFDTTKQICISNTINITDTQVENIADFDCYTRIHYFNRELYMIQDTSDEASLCYVLDSTIIHWSKAVEKLFGFTKEDIVGCKMDRIVPEDKKNEFLEINKKLGNGEKIQSYETIRKHKDGRNIHVSISVTPLYCENGKFFGVLVLYRDISEKRGLLNQLLTAEELWRSAIQGGKFGVWEWFIDTDHFVFRNDWPEAFGLYKDEVGNTLEEWFRLVHKEDVTLLREAFENAFRGKEFKCEYRFRAKDGRYIWTRGKGKITEWDDEGKPLKMVGTNEDITERRQLEEQLEHNCRRLEEAYINKTNFLSYISHEIRTPMNGMVGIFRLLNKTKLDSKQMKWLNMLQESLDSMMKVINNLLDQSKIEAGKLEPENNLCNIKMITKEIYNQLCILSKPKRLETKLYFDREIKHMVYSDRLRLKQILLNLVDNAVKFTNHGSISVEVRLLSSNDTTETLEFGIADTGIGIDEKEVSRIFEEFTQGNISAKKRSMGSGLGLSIAKNLAQLLNGDISVESVMGKGSTFRFCCTFTKYKKWNYLIEWKDESLAKSIDLGSVDHYKECGKDQIILVVEDNEINQEIISDVIKGCGCHFLNAYNVDDGLSLINKYQIDIILIDIQMPGLDCYELTKLIRRNERYRDVPIIAMTGYVTTEVQRYCIEAGMNDLITIPIDQQQFNDKINQLSK